MAAMWMVVIVGAAGYGLSVQSRTRRLAVANSLEKAQARAAADAALETVRAALQNRLARLLDARTRSLTDATLDPWGDLRFVRSDTIQLGDERATARVYDAGTRLQLNRASGADIRRLLVALRIDAGDADRLAQRIMDWRDADSFRRVRGAERDAYLRAGARTLPGDADFARVDELRDIDGMTAERYALIAPYVGTLGTGQINLNAAPGPVTASLPGVTAEVVVLIERAQKAQRAFRSLEEITQRLSPGARQALDDAGGALMQRVAFDTREVVVDAEGWVAGSPVRARSEMLHVRGGDAMFTVWRRNGP